MTARNEGNVENMYPRTSTSKKKCEIRKKPRGLTRTRVSTVEQERRIHEHLPVISQKNQRTKHLRIDLGSEANLRVEVLGISNSRKTVAGTCIHCRTKQDSGKTQTTNKCQERQGARRKCPASGTQDWGEGMPPTQRPQSSKRAASSHSRAEASE